MLWGWVDARGKGESCAQRSGGRLIKGVCLLAPSRPALHTGVVPRLSVMAVVVSMLWVCVDGGRVESVDVCLMKRERKGEAR